MPYRIQIDDEIYKDDSGTSSGSSIPEYTTDPASPSTEDAWVLKTTTGGSGTAGKIYGMLGLSLPLVEAGGGSTSYQLSYRTLEGSTIRVTMS